MVSGLQSSVSAVPAVNVLKPFLPARGCTFIFNTRNTRTHARILAAETSVHGPGRSLQLSPRPKTTPVLVSLPQPWTVLYKYRIRTCTFARSPDHQHHVITSSHLFLCLSPPVSSRGIKRKTGLTLVLKKKKKKKKKKKERTAKRARQLHSHSIFRRPSALAPQNHTPNTTVPPPPLLPPGRRVVDHCRLWTVPSPYHPRGRTDLNSGKGRSKKFHRPSFPPSSDTNYRVPKYASTPPFLSLLLPFLSQQPSHAVLPGRSHIFLFLARSVFLPPSPALGSWLSLYSPFYRTYYSTVARTYSCTCAPPRTRFATNINLHRLPDDQPPSISDSQPPPGAESLLRHKHSLGPSLIFVTTCVDSTWAPFAPCAFLLSRAWRLVESSAHFP